MHFRRLASYPIARICGVFFIVYVLVGILLKGISLSRVKVFKRWI